MGGVVSRMINADHLVGTAEIAQRLGVKRYNLVNDWIRRYEDFPTPVATISGVKIWSWPDVEAWARDTGRI